MALITVNKKSIVDLKMTIIDLNEKPHLFKLSLQCRDVLRNGKIIPEYTICRMPSLSGYGAVVCLVMLAGFATVINNSATVKISNDTQRAGALSDDAFVRLALSNFTERFGINLTLTLPIPAVIREEDGCYINSEFVAELHTRFKEHGHTFKWND